MARKQRYPELSLMARMIAGTGYLAITVGVIAGTAGAYLAYQNNDGDTMLGSIALGAGACFYGFLTIAASQVIRLLIDIERNTRSKEPTAADLLGR